MTFWCFFGILLILFGLDVAFSIRQIIFKYLGILVLCFKNYVYTKIWGLKKLFSSSSLYECTFYLNGKFYTIPIKQQIPKFITFCDRKLERYLGPYKNLYGITSLSPNDLGENSVSIKYLGNEEKKFEKEEKIVL
jgi:hypothetical protein